MHNVFLHAGKGEEKKKKSLVILCLVNHWYQNNQFVSGSGPQVWEMSNQKDVQLPNKAISPPVDKNIVAFRGPPPPPIHENKNCTWLI